MSTAAAPELASGTPMFVFDRDLQVVAWNEGAERLTGIETADAVGRPCWDVFRGHDDDGNLVCHPGCSRARQLREGRCVATTALNVPTPCGRLRLRVESISVRDEGRPLFVHMLSDEPAPAAEARRGPEGPQPVLTPRQREILGLLADGQPVKTVARSLGLMETTVRNHVRGLFLALGAHSQLEAVARARAFELI